MATIYYLLDGVERTLFCKYADTVKTCELILRLNGRVRSVRHN